MEQLADHGNGNYAYIDGLLEARRVLVDQMGATLVTVANDVKLQVEFNPAQVKGYRLIGYENRRLRDEEFNDDTRDGGDLGAGHSVTALYEIIPAGSDEPVPSVDALRYQQIAPRPDVGVDEVLTVKLRYKRPEESESRLFAKTLVKPTAGDDGPSDAFRFASAVAEFGLARTVRAGSGEHVRFPVSDFQDGVYAIDAAAGSDGFDPVLYLYRWAGNRLVEIASDDDGGDHRNSRIRVRLDSTETRPRRAHRRHARCRRGRGVGQRVAVRVAERARDVHLQPGPGRQGAGPAGCRPLRAVGCCARAGLATAAATLKRDHGRERSAASARTSPPPPRAATT